MISAPTIKLANVQALRGIAALGVALSHLLAIEAKNSGDQIWNYWLSFGMVGVDLFFVISGFIMVYVTTNLPEGLRSSASFLFARVLRIYPLYWLVSLVVLAVWAFWPDLVFSSVEGDPNIVKSFALYPDERYPLLILGWTLIHEMGFYLVFALSLLFPRRFLPHFLVVWGMIVGAGFAMKLGAGSPVLTILFSPLTFEFLLGAFGAIVFLRYSGGYGRTAFLAGIASLLVAVLLAGAKYKFMIGPHEWRAIYFAVPCALIVYGAVSTEHVKAYLFPPFVQTLGDWSYSLYLTHVLVMSLIGYMWRPMTSAGPIDNLIASIAMLGLSILGAAITYRLFEKPTIMLAKRWRKGLFSRD